jgi:hypothetical protein
VTKIRWVGVTIFKNSAWTVPETLRHRRRIVLRLSIGALMPAGLLERRRANEWPSP